MNIDDIKLIKLVSGEEFLAETIVNEGEGSVTFKNPVVAVATEPRTPGGEPGLGFMPWFHFAHQTIFTLGIEKVMVVADRYEPSLQKAYYDQFNDTGLIVPSEKKIITNP